MSSVCNWKRNVFVLCFAVGCTSASYTMLIPFLPMYLLELGVSQSEVAMYSGGVFSVTFFVAAIMAPIWGKMADKKGKRLMAIRAGIGLSFTYFLGGFVTSPEQLFVVRILQGFANGFLPASLAIASSSAPPEELGSSLGIVQTGQILGMVLGPLLGGVIAEAIGMRSSFYLAGLLLFFVVLLVVFFVQEPSAEVEVMKNVEKSVKKSVKGDSILDDFRYAVHNRLLLEMLVLTFIISLSNMVLQPVISLYIAQLQGSMENVMFTSGLIFSLGGVAGAISTAPWGAFGQRRGYFLVMVLAFCGAGIFNFLQYFPSTVVGFGVLQFFFGLFFVGTNPAVSAMLVKSTKADFRGRVFGLATTANQSGAMVGPLIGSFISMLFGIQYVFLITGPLLFFIGIAIWHRYLYTSA